jgi:hypothetical protein
MKISGAYGDDIYNFLKENHRARTGGRVDLAAYFLRRGFDLLRDGGDLCFITTNTIAQGDSRDAGLLPMTREWGAVIANALTSETWKGDATVTVSVVHLHRGPYSGAVSLDDANVDHIGPDLSSGDTGEPRALSENENIASVGSNIMGAGFRLRPDERAALVAENAANAEVIRPLYGGSDVMQSASTTPSRWVIDFGSRTLEDAAQYAEPLARVRALVKPERDKVKRTVYRERWWRFGEPASRLYDMIRTAGLEQVVVMPYTSKVMMPAFLPADAVYADTLVVFASGRHDLAGILASSIHWLWAAKWCATLRGDPRYLPARCFATFPLPPESAAVADAGAELFQYRTQMVEARGAGITNVYNLVNDPTTSADDALELRRLHVRLDAAVARAYDWNDLIDSFDHGCHPTKRFGVRWTVNPQAQRQIIERLLALNLQRAGAPAGDYAVAEVEEDELAPVC